MDQPGLDPVAHASALNALERINWWSGSAGILWPALRDLLRAQAPRPVRVLDVACGAGDVALRLARRARRAGLPLEIAGCDVSDTALSFARERAKHSDVPVEFFSFDALNDPLLTNYDVVTTSLFLHHLDEEDAVTLLRRLGEMAGRLLLVNDLARCRLGYMAAWLGTRVLSRSWVARIDGPLSVAGAFTPAEALEMARQAGLAEAPVARRWPFRFLLTWRRPT